MQTVMSEDAASFRFCKGRLTEQSENAQSTRSKFIYY